jgi:hypothetical protein
VRGIRGGRQESGHHPHGQFSVPRFRFSAGMLQFALRQGNHASEVFLLREIFANRNARSIKRFVESKTESPDEQLLCH